MKAVVIYQKGGLPQYAEIADPVVKNEDELLVRVKAVAIKHFDKGKAAGTHYSSDAATENARVIGGDGVCMLSNGERVYALGEGGMLAEKAIIAKERMVHLPEGIGDSTAAALPNAVIGSAMGLRFRADMHRGETVLINGATGFTGRVAVQVAKHYGAKKIIVTGRNPKSLQELTDLGADEMISLDQTDEQIFAGFQEIHTSTPIDIIIDYLWGHSAELILAALKGTGSFTHKTKYVSVGSMMGDSIRLSAANLRSADLLITGSGLGSWSKEQVRKLFTEILPEMFKLAAEGRLLIDTVDVKLEDISALWDLDVPAGKRLVVTI